MREAQFDISSLRAGTGGVDDFFWPVARHEVLAVRDAFLKGAVPFLKQEGAHDRRAKLLGMLIHILGELLIAYQAHALVRRSRDVGREPRFSPYARLSRALADGRLPEEARAVSQLRLGVRPIPFWRRSAAAIRDRLRGETVRRGVLASVDLRNEIVTVAVGDMIRQHAAEVGPVYHIGFDEWFPALQSGERGGFAGELGDTMLEAMTNYLRQAFLAGGEELPEILEQHFRWWIREATDLADRYLTRLLRQPKRLPSRLWRGTGGHLWGRLLSFAVRENGGHVTGHDHSHGQGAWFSASDTIIEHPFCDRFMVWSHTQKVMAMRNMVAELHLPGNPPEIAVVPGKFRPRIASSWQDRVHRHGETTVMYVGTLYVDDFVPYSPLLPGPVLLDWEIRLISHLKECGCKVLVKPHPENLGGAPLKFFEELGATVIGGRFEEVWNRADILLFAQPNSSSFFSALATHVPIILPRLEVNPWQNEALELLQKRCALLPCGIEQDNRIATSGAELVHALQTAPELKDDGFYRAFFIG